MFNRLVFILLLNLGAIGLHSYLALNHYSVKGGQNAGELVCDINSSFSCSEVTQSPYSEIFGVPIALFGGLTHFILLLIALGLLIGFFNDPKEARRYQLYLSFFTALTSLIMAPISIFLVGKLCLFCLILYFVSFALAYLTFAESPKPIFSSLGQDLNRLLTGKSLTFLLFLIAIPALAFTINQSLKRGEGSQNMDSKQAKMAIEEGHSRWVRANPTDFAQVAPLLTSGASPENARLTVTEFADFLCSHCMKAAKPTKGFVNKHKSDVRLEFYVFPLDGECNEKIPKRNGNTCVLAKSVYCAEKNNNGWAMHDHIFENQRKYMSSSLTDLKKNLGEFYQSINPLYSGDKLLECVDSEDALKVIKAQAKLGVDIDIKGTPTFFANKKKVNHFGMLNPVLEKILETVKNEK